MKINDVAKFRQAKAMAFRLGFAVHEADDPTGRNRYTLVRQAVETEFATIDELLAELKQIKS
jgi:hypothetical protein